MKDYQNHFDIVWSGGPLIPPRRSKPPRWWTMGAGHALMESDPKETERLKQATRPKLAYNKTGKHGRVSVIQCGPVVTTGEPSTPGAGARGLGPEPVQDSPHHSTQPTTETP